jgi:thiamine pyridinylase
MTRRSLLLIVFLAVSCRTAAPVVPQIDYELEVAIYPVANADTIASRVQSEFQAAYLQYTVTVTAADMAGLYDPATVAQWLSSGTYDLVEADMLLLEAIRDELATTGTPLPAWQQPPYVQDWSPAAARSSTIGGDVYGVPHYGCGYFLFTTDQALSQITASPAFLQALGRIADKKTYPP